MNIDPALVRTTGLRPAYQKLVYAPFETVEITKSQPSRGLVRGMVGRILQQFGNPPTHYCVAVSEAGSYGIFPASALRLPRQVSAAALSPEMRSASDAHLFASLGFATNDSSLGDAPSAACAGDAANIKRQLLDGLSAVTYELVDCPKGFVARYGLVMDAVVPIRGLLGGAVETLNGVYYPRLPSGDLSDSAEVAVMMPIRLLDEAVGTVSLLRAEVGAGWPGLPEELWAAVVGYMPVDSLSAFSCVSKNARRLASAELSRTQRAEEFLEAVHSSSRRQYGDIVKNNIGVLRQYPKWFSLPRDASAHEIRNIVEATEASRARIRLFANGFDKIRAYANLPPHVGVDGEASWDALEHSGQISRFPDNLLALKLNVDNSCSQGLRAIAAALPAQTELTLSLDGLEYMSKNDVLPAMPGLCKLILSGDFFDYAALRNIVQAKNLGALVLNNNDQYATTGRLYPYHADAPRLLLSSKIVCLDAPPLLFSHVRQTDLLWQLRILCVEGCQFGAIGPAIGRIPFLDDLTLLETVTTPSPEDADQQELGLWLSRWPLGASVTQLKIKSQTLAPFLGEVHWPQKLISLDLSFSFLGGSARLLRSLHGVQEMNLICTELEDAVFDVNWPAQLRKVSIDLDDIPWGTAEILSERFPRITFDFHDL